MPQITDPVDTVKQRKAYRALVRAAALEISLGVVWAVFPFAGRGSFHIVAGIVIVAGGLVLLGLALRVRSKSAGK
jgi:small neutral amino acid transporter SnatA (MarC family)